MEQPVVVGCPTGGSGNGGQYAQLPVAQSEQRIYSLRILEGQFYLILNAVLLRFMAVVFDGDDFIIVTQTCDCPLLVSS